MSDIRPADAAINHLKRYYTPGSGRASQDPESETPLELDVELIWPPPGLEHLHGLLTRVTGSLLLAGIILTAAIALPAWLDRVPENGSWGSVVAFIIAGVMLWAAYMWLLVMFNRIATGIRAGYPRQLVWQVAADAPRNTFEILLGRGAYERMTVEQRRALLNARVYAGILGAAGAFWLTTSLPVLLGFGAGGSLSERTIWLIVLLPSLLCLAVSAYFRVRDVRLDYGNRIPDEEARNQQQQARAWRRFLDHIGFPARDAIGVAGYRIGAAAAFLAVFIMLVPIGIAVFTTFVPYLIRSNPTLYSHSVRMSAMSPLRAYNELAEQFRIADDAGSTNEATRATIAVQMAADSLAERYRANGRAAEAERIDGVIEAASAAARTALKLGLGSSLRIDALERIVYDRSTPLAYRWQALAQVSRQRRCGTLASIVFGTSARYRRFEEAARSSLVRTDADERRFQALTRGNGATIEDARTRCTLDWVRGAVRGGR